MNHPLKKKTAQNKTILQKDAQRHFQLSLFFVEDTDAGIMSISFQTHVQKAERLHSFNGNGPILPNFQMLLWSDMHATL